ncbi:MAG: hypothetical protein FWC91_11450 [Defluviitaleaceae bacterium]|nr:hypothetical protein [Defluviitaleaceae bacterium]
MFLVETPTWVLLLPFGLICATAYFSAKRYANTNDFKKSCKLFFPIGIIIALLFNLAGLPLILGGFMVFSGFVIMMFFSNQIFND